MNARQLTLGFLTIADVPPLNIVQTGAEAGFEAIGLRITGRAVGDDWFPVLEDRGMVTDIRQAAESTGVRLSNVAGYYLDGKTTVNDSIPVFEVTAELGISLMVQGCFDPDEERLVSSLRAHCAEAARYGVRVGIEFMRASAVKTLAQAKRLLARVDAPNAGLVIDALHLARSGDSIATMSELPAEQIYLFQICDAVDQKPEAISYMEEALTGRLYPGHGQLPLQSMLDALPEGLEIECEMPCSAERSLPALQRAENARRTTRAFLDDRAKV